MDSEYKDEMGLEEEPRDWTKVVWLAIFAAVALMVVALWFMVGRSGPPNVSRARVEHILISANMTDPVDRQRALEQAREIRQRLQGGESFATLARQYSNDPHSSQRGGDLGWENRGTYEEAFENFVWDPNRQPGVIYDDLVRTGRGYHIIRIRDRQYSLVDQHELDRRQQRRQAVTSP